MYLPSHFREDRLDVLHEFIERHPLGALVAATDGELTANHLPMLLARSEGEKGTLHGHLARGNPLWKSLAAGSDVLVIFGGADAYISPSWYAEKALTGKVVPTWNYAVAHVRGCIEFFDDANRLHALVSSLTDHNERNQPLPWSVDDAPEPYVQAQLRAIVGFRIQIRDIVGKFKASQNKSDADRAGIHDALKSRHAADLDELVRSRRKSTAMHQWHCLQLGDALTAHLALESIRESFETHYPPADRPVDASVYARHESTGGVHCEVIAFFSPAAATLAREFDAKPCNPPDPDALQRLAGRLGAD